MLKGKTRHGFYYEVTDERLNNYDLIELMAEVDENPLLVPKILTALLGKEQKKEMLDFLRNKDGIIEANKIQESVEDILHVEEVKN